MQLHQIFHKKVHHGISAVAIILSIVIPMILFNIPLRAQAIGGSFGGKITFKRMCTCSASTLILVNSPRGGWFMRMPSATVFGKGRTEPGAWILGIASGFQPCLITCPCPQCCCPSGGGQVIRMFGTN